jgi:hypothetical protein
MRKILILLILILFFDSLNTKAASEFREKKLPCPKVLKQCTDVDSLFLLTGIDLSEGIALGSEDVIIEAVIQQCRSCCVSESPNSKCINRCLKKCKKLDFDSSVLNTLGEENDTQPVDDLLNN